MPTRGLQGTPEFRARLKAIAATKVFTPLGKKWADETVRLQRKDVPNRNTRWSKGRLHDSIRRKSATQRKAVVVGHYTGYFVDAGVKPHSLQRRGKKNRGTVFARAARKGHPGYKARPFRAKSAREALRRHPMSAEVIALWNRAAQMGFRADTRAAIVDLVTDYGQSVGLRLQVYPGRPRSIMPPTAFVDLMDEDDDHTTLRTKRNSSPSFILIHGIYDSKEAVDQADAFVDGFFEWIEANIHAAGPNTTIGVAGFDDLPNFIAEWMPPDKQLVYYATRARLTGFAAY